ncbi:hypothetical protein OC691_00815 ['Cleome sp.' phytoplasma]|uniref:hypothetical protein n=1 Tax=Candidatus Phytoplasma australasiaticum TaxID=2754999 RepID=UPI002712EDA3|nr:hypothetical protein ['Cleome sp.' phytoplasma]MDO8054918.1 hypothetical protein ['Cleome sp.' phytoplasma]
MKKSNREKVNVFDVVNYLLKHFEANNPIPNHYICEGNPGNEINPETQEFMKKTLNDYIKSSYQLSVNIHNELPWKIAYNPRKKWKNNLITHQSLKDFLLKNQRKKNNNEFTHFQSHF